ncbi:hypothetical protein KCU85_g503, partial [Aureobasidium melanogenum]
LAIVVEKGREFVLVRRDNHRRCLLFLRRRSRLLVMRLHRRIRGGGRLVVHRVFRSLRRRFEMYCSRRSGDILDLANGRRTSLFLRNHYNLQILFEEHVDGRISSSSFRHCSSMLTADLLHTGQRYVTGHKLDSLPVAMRRRGIRDIEDNHSLLLSLRRDVCCWLILRCRPFTTTTNTTVIAVIYALCAIIVPKFAFGTVVVGRVNTTHVLCHFTIEAVSEG